MFNQLHQFKKATLGQPSKSTSYWSAIEMGNNDRVPENGVLS